MIKLKSITFIFLTLVAIPCWAGNFEQIVEGQQVFLNSSTPPPASADWQPTRMPYHNRQVHADEHPPVVWFRFVITEQDTPSAVYLWRYQMRAQFFLNDVPLGGTSAQPAAMTSYWNHPLLVNIPNSAWQPGENLLFLRIASDVQGPVSSPILFGDHLALLDLWQERTFRQVEMSRFSFYLCLGLALLALWLWRTRLQEKLYLYYAGACLSWAVVSWYLWDVTFPLPVMLFLALVHICIDLTILLLLMFVNQAMRLDLDKLQTAALVVWLINIPATLSVSPNYFFQLVYLVHFAGLLLLMFFIGRGAYVAFKTRVSGSWWIAATLVGVFWMGMHDTYTFIFAADEEWIAQGFVSQYSAILILLCFFGHLGQRFVDALNETDQLNRELEGRVAQKEQELQGIYAEALQLEVAKSNLRQREQIYRDLHDDVGAKLVSIIQATEENKSSNYARAALESLRAAIFQAKYPELSLRHLLDGCEEEALLRAEVMGKELQWKQVGEASIELPSETNYHLTRIIREAISNSLKFGLNSPIDVVVELSAEHLRLTIRNSVFATEPALSGFSSGLTNIRFRADCIGAEVEWHAADVDMHFTLSLPLPLSERPVDADAAASMGENTQ